MSERCIRTLWGYGKVCWLSSFIISIMEYWILGSAPGLSVWFTEQGNGMCSSFIWAVGFIAGVKTRFGFWSVRRFRPHACEWAADRRWCHCYGCLAAVREQGRLVGFPQARLMGIAFWDINKHDLQSTSIQQPSKKAAFFSLAVSSESSSLSSSSSSSSSCLALCQSLVHTSVEVI